MKEVELYVHIPFCVKKCKYCDFLSFPSSVEQRGNYVDALVREIKTKRWPDLPTCVLEADSREEEQFYVSSIFIGGGTPSVLKVQEIERIMEAIQSTFVVAMDGEITMECNPGTVDVEQLKELKRIGINRISFGLQSCKNMELEKLGRIHNYETFLKNYNEAREVGFTNINIDIMSALPGQSLKDYQDSLRQVIGLNPEHVSAYSLIIEEGTPFYDLYEGDEKHREAGLDPGELPSEDVEREMYELTGRLLQEAGYEHYEISNYARPGKRCKHNEGYWRRRNYLGYGLGASSLYEDQRFKNISEIGRYNEFWGRNYRNVKGDLSSEIVVTLPEEIMTREQLTKQAQREEFFFLGLRLLEGVSKSEFREMFGQSVQEVYGRELEELEKQGLIACKGDTIKLTSYGIDISNYVLSKFIM